VANATHCDIVICPPFPNLAAAVEATRGTRIEIGGQNLYWAKEGAFTGEVSGPMLAGVGARWVIVGHSERRQYFGESDETVLKRTVAALEAGPKPIVCVGERLAEREAGRTEVVLERQFSDGIAGLAPELFARIAIAYEPVWAIGTGKTATPAQAQEVHAFIRGLLGRKFGDAVAQATRIQYGGSVNPANARGLLEQPDIDGALVGGASLKVQDFVQIVRAAG
jgi:triosephosphate isomerase